ncbi:hypothetical protein D3875_19690 [Deinococcus cavernae]|uniref:CAP domain-containing protein n=2 Tax=Deinococcus cavernae TaxID=2320857 RepID=A0A418VCR1_9DEIO|nr:hypothetical protein D3875_19690 [Deinococcus cavernae]
MKKTLSFFALGLTLLLASCNQGSNPSGTAPGQTGTAPQPGAGTDTIASGEALSPLGVAAATTLTVGQTRQFNVTVNGAAPTPGQLVWTTTNAGVVSVTQTGLATARAAGSATVRAALASYPSAYIDFPITVTATIPTPTSPTTTFAQRVLELTNAARAQARTCGTTTYAATTPLVYNALLEKAAQGHATDMATKNYFSHTSQDGRTFAQRISDTGYAWRTIGENIAAGQSTPESVVSGWLQSPGHCANIMNPAFKELSVGYAYNTSSSYRYYWVQDFGAR